MGLWQTSKDREKLLKQFVSHDSVTHSDGEKTFVNLVQKTLEQYPISKKVNVFILHILMITAAH